MSVLVLSEHDVRRLLDMESCIAAMEDVLTSLARGVSLAGLALAWLLRVPEVTAVIVGPTRAEHLEPVREALFLDLTSEERAHLRGLFP